MEQLLIPVKFYVTFSVTFFHMLEPMEIKRRFSNNLKACRQLSGMTQKEVAEKLHMARENYSRYERGVIELDYYKMIQLCKILKVTPNDLFDSCLD